MSQPIYENRFFSTDEMLKEYIRRVIYRKIFLLGGIFALLALVMLLVTWRDGEPVFMAIFGICLFIILAILIFSPSLTLRQVKEDNRRLHNGQTYESVVRFGDRILMQEGTFSFACDYSQIVRLHKLSHCWVLMFGPRNGILLDPTHFTTGDPDGFEAFLRERCPRQSDTTSKNEALGSPSGLPSAFPQRQTPPARFTSRGCFRPHRSKD